MWAMVGAEVVKALGAGSESVKRDAVMTTARACVGEVWMGCEGAWEGGECVSYC